MKAQLYKLIIPVLLVTGFAGTGCFDDLNTVPLDEDVITAEKVYEDPESYRKVLAKLYAGQSVTGQQGPAGQPDIEGIDEGFGQYLRGFWYHQELTTDEAIIGWNDQTIKDFHDQKWSADDGFIFAFYSRVFYQIAVCNEFLRETTDEKLAGRDVDDALYNEIQGYRAEARFLRALSYWHALDLFRNVPFVTEDDIVGSFFPEQILAPDLFVFIESELLDIEGSIAAPRTNEYGRADQGAVWTLLAKLYLNAEVYIDEPHYEECLEYCEKVIGAGYTLDPNYARMFMADNHTSPEIIFPVTFDGVSTRTWGGTTFIMRAGIGGSMDPTASGVASGWGGTRTTRQFFELYPDAGGLIVERNEGDTRFYQKLYMPGDYQGWNWSNVMTTLSSPEGDRIFEGYRYFNDGELGFLFTQVPDQALILGDNDGDGTLDRDGDTIRVPEPGYYRIEADINTMTYSVTKTDWGIVGSATPGGWDNDTEMAWNPDEGAVEAFLDLTEGQMKFRANGNWDINLGDDLGDAILTQGAADIEVEKTGSYHVLLYLEQHDFSYEMRLTSFDDRGKFHTEGQNIDIDDVSLFTEGIAINKFKNVTSDGFQGSDTDHADTDFPMFRYADVLLMASEAILRANGNKAVALDYFNQVRTRAFGSEAGGVTMEELDLDLMLEERARELYWECHRRTDLVRFGQFTDGDYLWAWKGGVPDGTTVDPRRDIFPIPSSDIGANSNLKQNPGY